MAQGDRFERIVDNVTGLLGLAFLAFLAAFVLRFLYLILFT